MNNMHEIPTAPLDPELSDNLHSFELEGFVKKAPSLYELAAEISRTNAIRRSALPIEALEKALRNW